MTNARKKFLKDRPLYTTWINVRQRCNNPKVPDFKIYGGRGITVCRRWDSYSLFEKDLLPTYKKGLTIDRINTNKGYSPKNVRWATMKTQQNNRRNNFRIAYKGFNKTLIEWAEYMNINYSAVRQRYYTYHWNTEKLLKEAI